jgi:hypothetical protein
MELSLPADYFADKVSCFFSEKFTSSIGCMAVNTQAVERH